MIRLVEFIDQEAERIWDGASRKHLAESLVKLDRFCAFAGYGHKRMSDFAPKDLHRFQDHLRAVGLTDSTINHYNSAISRIFGHAVDMEYIDKAPKIKWKKVPRNGRPKHFTDEEVLLIRRFLRGHRHNWIEHFFVLALNTGMRLGEIRKIGTEEAYVDQDKDGRYWVRLLTTKNGDQRDVPLNTAAVEALKALDWNAEAAYDHRPFYNTIGEMRDRLFNRDRSVVFHVTRSTALTNMAERGINPYMMSKFVGHRDIQTTLRYVKGKQSALAKIADELLD